MPTTNHHPSVLAQLRVLIPKRPLSFHEALRLTELQANRFRGLLDHTEPDLSEEIISGLPRVEVTREADLPVSGLTQWHNGRWIIALNATEPLVRQHFSLAHELFHIINHHTKQWLHPTDHRHSAHRKGEQLADYFAGCLLMPKRHVKALHAQRLDVQGLADAFSVSVRAMTVRLAQLGITEPTPRCIWPSNSYRRVVKPYIRHVEGVAA